MLHISIVGLLLTIVLERLLIPRPALRRPLSCWLLHTGVWCVSLAVLYALTARPLFSAINVVLGWLLIVMVSNAKYHSLREPFVCADFEYFSDAVRFPRLYLPFFGIGKAALLATGFIAYLWAGLTFEPQVAGGRLDALWLGLGGLILLKLGHRSSVPSFDANADIQRWGLVAC
ncbi:MAG: LTA synthase family protein, partial [Pseudomonadales bacterium]|nr:LTA synthase family protein [Pseudomonadales bacterium]